MILINQSLKNSNPQLEDKSDKVTLKKISPSNLWLALRSEKDYFIRPCQTQRLNHCLETPKCEHDPSSKDRCILL